MSNLSDIMIPSVEHLSRGGLYATFSEELGCDEEIRREIRLYHLCSGDTSPLYILSPDAQAEPRSAWHASIGEIRRDLEPGFQMAQIFFSRMAGQVIRRLSDYIPEQIPSPSLQQEVLLNVDWLPYPISGETFTRAIAQVFCVEPNASFAWEITGRLLEPKKTSNMTGIELVRRDGVKDSLIFRALQDGAIDDLLIELRNGLCGMARK